MTPEQMKSSVAMICDTIGRKVVADRIGVGKTAVSNAVVEGIFPARWYREMRSLCAEHDLPCPDDLFNFVSAPNEAGAA